MRNAATRMPVPIQVRHGYIRTLRVASASSKDTSSRQCAVRWQMTKAIMTSALASRSLARHWRKSQTFIRIVPSRRANRGALAMIAESGEKFHATKNYRRLSALVAVPGRNGTAARIVELIGFRKTLGRKAPGVGAVAAPVGKLFQRQIENPAGGIGPGQTLFHLECFYVGEAAVLVTLQAHAAAARHVRHLVDREDEHFAV